MNPYVSGGIGGVLGAGLGGLGGILGAPRRGVASAMQYFGLGPQPGQGGMAPGGPMDYTGMGGSETGMPAYMPMPDLGMTVDEFGNPTTIPGPQSFVDFMGNEGPRETATSSLDQSKGGSLLPMLLGAGGAGLAALFSGGALAPLGFAAGSGIGQLFNEGFGRADSVDMTNIMGDQGFVGNFVTGAAFDPMTYAGMGAGIRAGMPGARSQTLNRLDDFTSARGLGQQQAVLPPAPRGFMPTAEMPPVVPPQMQMLDVPPPPMPPSQPQMPFMSYDPATLGQALGVGGPVDVQAMGAAKAYQRVDPQMGALLGQMGMMPQPGQFPGGLPNFAQMRGGWVKPNPQMAGALPHLEDLSGLTGDFGHAARVRMMERMGNLGYGAGSNLPVPPGPELQRLYDIQGRLQATGAAAGAAAPWAPSPALERLYEIQRQLQGLAQ